MGIGSARPFTTAAAQKQQGPEEWSAQRHTPTHSAATRVTQGHYEGKLRSEVIAGPEEPDGAGRCCHECLAERLRSPIVRRRRCYAGASSAVQRPLAARVPTVPRPHSSSQAWVSDCAGLSKILLILGRLPLSGYQKLI
jgi:hypothetical protein